MDQNKIKDILPATGVWTIEDFSRWLGVKTNVVQQKLSDLGVPIISFSRLYRYKIFRLEDLKGRLTNPHSCQGGDLANLGPS